MSVGLLIGSTDGEIVLDARLHALNSFPNFSFSATTSYVSLAAFYGIFTLRFMAYMSVTETFLFSDGNQFTFYGVHLAF